jgi:hypothetical protein
MPRETIKDEDGGVVAQVVWSPDQYVQLATLSTDPATFIAWCRDLVSEYDEIQEAIKRTGPGSDETGFGRNLGMFWSPRRREINELIRVLRRTRNSAYGADE